MKTDRGAWTTIARSVAWGFGSSIGRKLGGLIIAAIIAVVMLALGSGEAQAQVGPTECTSTNRCARPTAYEACMVAKSEADAVKPPGDPQINCTTTAGPTANGLYQCGNYWQGCSAYVPAIGRNSWNFYGCPVGQEWNETTKTCGNPCQLTDPPLTASAGALALPSMEAMEDTIYACHNSCSYLATDNLKYSVIDGTYYLEVDGWTPRGETCTGGDAPATPPQDSDGDGTSDGNDSAPNNPGEGEEQPPPLEPGECGGAGQPPCESQESDPNRSSGGGDCNTPPSSSGDPILAQIAFQTWATRCAITGKANTPGTGTPGAPGSGDDDTETNGLLEENNSLLSDLKGWVTGNGQALDEAPPTPWQEGSGEGSEWGSGLGSGSCPAADTVTVSLFSVSKEIAFSYQPLCDLAGLMYWVTVSAASLLVAFLFGGLRR